MNWILLSPPPLSSDPDNPPKFGTCTSPNRVKWDVLKCKIRQFSMKYSIRAALDRKRTGMNLESKVETLREVLLSNCDESAKHEYEQSKGQLKILYDHIKEGIILPSKAMVREKESQIDISSNLKRIVKVKFIFVKITDGRKKY